MGFFSNAVLLSTHEKLYLGKLRLKTLASALKKNMKEHRENVLWCKAFSDMFFIKPKIGILW